VWVQVWVWVWVWVWVCVCMVGMYVQGATFLTGFTEKPQI